MENNSEQSVKKTLPKRTIDVEFKSNTYSFEYPNTGGIIDIEVLKSSLAKEQYDSIDRSNSNQGQYAKFLIDAIATINVLDKERKIKEDLKVTSMLQLDVLDSKLILDVYLKKILPWMQEWEDILNAPFDEIDLGK